MGKLFVLVLLDSLCQGPATPAGSAYLECQPEIGDVAYCPGDEQAEEADCVVTHVSNLHNGRSIVSWELAK